MAQVDDSGLVTGVAEGEAEITATSSGVTGRAQVTVVAPVPTTERDILVALYRATDGPNWVNSDNWLTDAPLRSWYGVVVNGERRLVKIDLARNNLSGPIPPELGELSSLQRLYLDENALTGPIPPELGNLSSLYTLQLSDNKLTGPVPPEFGRLTRLMEMGLANNAGMSGALPTSLTALRRLDVLATVRTDLCAPSDADFLAWLDGVRKRRIAPCVRGAGTMAYLTQAVQSREFPVPLVAGERALLRVFVTAQQATNVGIPRVRATFYLGGGEAHVTDIPGKLVAIPEEVDESILSKSSNAEIPGEIVQPGLEMVINIDPEGTLDSALGVTRRIPETGRMAVDVRAMPLFDLTVIPFLWSEAPDSSILDMAKGMASDPENHDLLWHTRTLLPVGDLEVAAHEPVVSSSNSARTIFGETKAIRVMEGGTGHYMGMMTRPVTGAGGLADVPGRWIFSLPISDFIAHELGHNFSLEHAPCGNAGGPDPSYPYADGSIGAWGYDFRDGGSLVSPRTADLMSYCDPDWISDFYFANALRFRLSDEGAPTAAALTTPARSLLLWGGVDAAGDPFLEPAFVVDAPPALPQSGGEYEVTGLTATGGELFSLSFDMPEVSDGDGSSGFTFALPVRPEWAGALASITLAGPDGSVTLDRESNRPMAILRNPRNGQVRGILRDLPASTQAAMDATARAAGPDLEMLFSRGIPGAEAWRR